MNPTNISSQAIRKFVVRTIVDTSSARDLKEMSAIDTYILPRLYIKQQYCVSCAIHARIVRVRSNEIRHKRRVLTRTIENHAAPQRNARRIILDFVKERFGEGISLGGCCVGFSRVV